MRKTISILCLLALALCWGAEGQGAKRKEKKDATPKKAETPYQKLFKNKPVKTVKGFLTVHQMGDKIYVEFPLHLLNADMLLTSSIRDISDNGEGVVGEFAGKPIHLRFTKHDTLLQARMLMSNTPLNSSQDDNLGTALSLANQGGVFKTFKIEAYTPDSTGVVVNMSGLFLEHSRHTTPFPAIAANSFEGFVSRKHELKKEMSRLKDIGTNTDNVTVTCELAYGLSRTAFFIFLIDEDTPLTVTVDKMLSLLPENPMAVRYADSRIGVEIEEQTEFSSGGGVKQRYYVTRWRVEPSDAEKYRAGQTVAPKKQLLFYMDTLMPEAWRKYVKAGAEAWNESFRKIGFTEVIRVKDFPKDDTLFDANNVNYSTIRFAPVWNGNVGTSVYTDPRTGEILNASIYVNNDLITELYLSAAVSTMAACPDVRCAVFTDERIGELLQLQITQAMGKCLGLTMNYGASYAYPVDSLRSPLFTREYGLSPSVMDGLECNYVARPEDAKRGVRLIPKGIGAYDDYVIKYLYSPVADSVLTRWIGEKQHDPIYRYRKLQKPKYDPAALAGDLGNDHLRTLRYWVENMKISVQHLNEWYADGDPDFTGRKLLYDGLLRKLDEQVGNVAGYIGGIYLNETYGESQEERYAVVPKEVQQKALKTLLQLTGDLSWMDKKNFAIETDLLCDNAALKRQKIFAILFSRLDMVALSASKAPDAYQPKEYADDLYRAVWAATIANRPLTKQEMGIQQDFVGASITTSGVKKTMGSANAKKCTDIIALKQAVANGFNPVPEIEIDKEPIGALYYGILLKTKKLLESAIPRSGGETKQHYEHLHFKLKQLLDTQRR